jgi:hypothetical protein
MSRPRRLDRKIDFDEPIHCTIRETVFTVANIKLLCQLKHDSHSSDNAIS